MVAKDINQDLDEYIKTRKGGKKPFSFKIRIGKAKGEPKMPKLASKKVHVVYGKPTFWERIFSRKQKEDLIEKEMFEQAEMAEMEQEISETETELESLKREERALEKRKDGLMTRLFRKMNVFAKEQDDLLEDMPVMEEKGLDPETVEVLKIAGRWIGKLSTQEKQAFKTSQDYQKYKSFLDKHGLTRK